MQVTFCFFAAFITSSSYARGRGGGMKIPSGELGTPSLLPKRPTRRSSWS